MDAASGVADVACARETILRSCLALFAAGGPGQPGQVVELRALRLGGDENRLSAGWFDDWGQLAAAAADLDLSEHAGGVYVTLNPVDPQIIERTGRDLNAVHPHQTPTTADRDILCRRWLPIDLDPARPSGVSSSAAELAAALSRADQIDEWLQGKLHWPAGLRACSGNGAHLCYRLPDLQNTPESYETVRRCLAAVHSRWESATVRVDRTVGNAARIFKLWGTTTRKGDNLPDRPWRQSYLLPGVDGQYPTFGRVLSLTADQIAALTELAPAAAVDVGGVAAPPTSKGRRARGSGSGKGGKAGGGDPPDFDLDAFISRHGIQVRRKEAWDTTGIRYVLHACLFDPTHTGTAAALGRTGAGRIFYKCMHDSCSSRQWSDVREQYEPKGVSPSNGTSRKGAGASSPGADGAAAKSSGRRQVTDDPWDLAREFLWEQYVDADGNLLLRHHRDAYYRSEPATGAYALYHDDSLENQIVLWLAGRAKVTRRLVADVMAAVRANVAIPTELDLPVYAEVQLGDEQPSIRTRSAPWGLAMRGGFLNLDKLIETPRRPQIECVEPHSPNWFNVRCLTYDYDPAAECEYWLAFLNQIFEGDQERVDLIQEAFGYCLWPSTTMEKYFIFTGHGQNGKSTVLNVLEEILGQSNCTSHSPQDIENKYMRGDLQHSVANICRDMGEIDRFAEGLIKRLVSGESMTSDRKWKSMIKFKTTCKLFFAANLIPRFEDITAGMWRRTMIVPFEVNVTEEDKIGNLTELLCRELPGIFNWSIDGLVRLKKEKRFTNSGICTRAVHLQRRACFPIQMFLDEETFLGESEGADAVVMWNRYKEWCRANGFDKIKPFHTFCRDVKSFRPTAILVKQADATDERPRWFQGIGMRPAELVGPGAGSGGGGGGGTGGGGGQQAYGW